MNKGMNEAELVSDKIPIHRAVVPTRGNLTPTDPSPGIFGDTFGSHNRVAGGRGVSSATGIECVEARDAAKRPTMHRKTPMRKNNLVQNDKSVEVGNPVTSGL